MRDWLLTLRILLAEHRACRLHYRLVGLKARDERARFLASTSFGEDDLREEALKLAERVCVTQAKMEDAVAAMEHLHHERERRKEARRVLDAYQFSEDQP